MYFDLQKLVLSSISKYHASSIYRLGLEAVEMDGREMPKEITA
jgi:hypothetical protein